MRSTDLTAAAQIREAAMRLFGERGVAAVSVREVAAAAGVSAALVIHHYGSKAGLKRAVDERAMQLLDELIDKSTDPQYAGASMASLADAFSDELGRLPTVLPYLRRLLVDGGEPATALFRALFEGTRAALRRMQDAGLVAASADDDTRAAFLLANDLGAVILREQLTAVLGFDPMAGDGLLRWGETVLRVYSAPTFLPPEQAS